MSPEVKRGPVSPMEAAEVQLEQIPEEVFGAFNSLISQNLSNGYARVLQKDVVALLESQGLNRSEIYKKHWLDVEDSYRRAGWRVEYDKPGYNEFYDAYFVFQSKNKRRH